MKGFFLSRTFADQSLTIISIENETLLSASIGNITNSNI